MILVPVVLGKNTNNVMANYPKQATSIRRVAVGIVFNSHQQILMARRHAHSDHAGLWEFPGGKFKSGETSYAALCREIKEELHLEVISAIPLMMFQYDYPQYSVLLDVWEIKEYQGVACGAEGQVIQWFPLAALDGLAVLAGSRRIIAKLLADQAE